MKSIPRILPSAALAACLAVSAFAEEPAGGDSGEKSAQEYQRLLRESAGFFAERNYSGAVAALDQAAKMRPDTLDALNLRGAIHAERGEFDQARPCFEKALALSPDAFWPKFNLAEILLMQHRAREAQERFEQLSATGPKAELIQFKIVLALLKQDRVDEARARLGSMPFPGESAAGYYAWAAWAFASHDEKLAGEWVRKSNEAFAQKANLVLYDSLADMGWVEKRKSK